MLLVLAALNPAAAATVAVLDFESWGASQADAETATEGLRSAILTAGFLDALPGSDIADGVSAETEGDLRAARDHAAEARRLYLSGDYPGAISAATQAVSEHANALSQVGRREEVADAWYTLGAACAKSQLTSNAADAFMHVAKLDPRYLEERATNVPSAVRPLLAAAEAAAGRPQLTHAEILQVRDALKVDWVVTGSIDDGGALEVQLWGAGGEDVKLYADFHGYSVGLPAPSIDDAYNSLATDIVRKAVIAPASVSARDDEPTDERTTQPTPRPAKKAGLSHEWWFWTGAVAVVGGGVAVGYAVWEPAPVQVPGPDTWSVTISGL